MLLEQQAAAQEQHAKHEDMQAMLDRHHRERMSMMKRLIILDVLMDTTDTSTTHTDTQTITEC